MKDIISIISSVTLEVFSVNPNLALWRAAYLGGTAVSLMDYGFPQRYEVSRMYASPTPTRKLAVTVEFRYVKEV